MFIKACFMHEAGTGKRGRCSKKPPPFMRNPFTRQMHCLRRQRANGCHRLNIYTRLPKAGQKPAIPQHTQGIFSDAGLCIPHKTQTPGCQISQTAKRVLKRSIGSDIERIDREIAAAGIFCPIIGKSDHGMPTVSLQINPRLGQLYRLAIRDNRNGAMRKAGFGDFQTGIAQGINSACNRTGDGHVNITGTGLR
jgi:hypothetical protein